MPNFDEKSTLLKTKEIRVLTFTSKLPTGYEANVTIVAWSGGKTSLVLSLWGGKTKKYYLGNELRAILWKRTGLLEKFKPELTQKKLTWDRQLLINDKWLLSDQG